MKKRKTPILVIGGSGFVGSHFLHLSNNLKHTLVAPSHTQLDIIERKNVHDYFLTFRPHFVINFAANSNIDDVEKERNDKKGLIWTLNYKGATHLVDACKKIDAFLLHISTDAVFAGTKHSPGPYHERAPVAKNKKDINWYGYTKLKAEKAVQKMGNGFAIVRISYPFGNPKNKRDLVAKAISDIEKGYGIFADQMFTPTFIEDVKNTIWSIYKKRESGIFHVGCKGVVSRLEFNRYLAKKLKLENEITTGSIHDFLKTHAPRSVLGGLLTAKTEKTLGVRFHTWQKALNKATSDYLSL